MPDLTADSLNLVDHFLNGVADCTYPLSNELVQRRCMQAVDICWQAAGILGLTERASDLKQRIQRVLLVDESEALYHRLAANIAFQEGRPEDGVRSLEQAVRIEPTSALRELELVTGYRYLFNWPAQPEHLLADREVLGHLRQAARKAPSSWEVHFEVAVELLRQSRHGEALEALAASISCDRGQVGPPVLCANVLGMTGRRAEALALCQSLKRVYPNVGTIYQIEADLRVHGPEDLADVRQLEERIASSGFFQGEERNRALYALGSMLDQLGRYDEAYRCYQSANAAQRPAYFDMAPYVEMVRERTRQYSEAVVRDPQVRGSESRLPLFIIGMPRSGTTLLQQILRAHMGADGARDISTAHELDTIQRAQMVVTALQGQDNPVPSADLAGCLAGVYLEQLREHSALDGVAEPAYVLNKRPNFMHIGMIRVLFPNARIIHCGRDSYDTCLSVFFRNFGDGSAYSHTLPEIAHYYRDFYMGWMKHWQQVLPQDVMLNVRYEDVVREPEREVRRMLEFLELEWSPACLDFHRQSGAIETEGRTRLPLYDSSIGRWTNYRSHLAEVFSILA